MAPADPPPSGDAPSATDPDKPPESIRRPAKPLLASEALMDDLAPREPYARRARALCLGMGVWFGALAAGPLLQGKALTPENQGAHGVLALLSIAFGAIPLRYDTRARLMLLVGAGAMLLGVAGLGPAEHVATVSGEWGLVHWLAAVALPAASLFRARYRAYADGRRILGVGLVLAMPFVADTAIAFPGASLATQIASVVAWVAVAASLVGFMGEQAPIAGGWLSATILCLVFGPMVARGSVPATPALDLVLRLASLLALLGSAALSALGALGVLAGRHWAEARNTSLRSSGQKRRALPSMNDWSTRR